MKNRRQSQHSPLPLTTVHRLNRLVITDRTNLGSIFDLVSSTSGVTKRIRFYITDCRKKNVQRGHYGRTGKL